ncbi:MAG: cytochrome C [Methylococcaceae bacterium]
MQKKINHSKQSLLSLAILTFISLLTLSDAQAVPSFTRQTGAACSQCHTQSFGPNLTPFGRDFKLGGYTLSNGKSNFPALSGMVVGSFNNTDKGVQNPDGIAGYNKNNNFVFDEASLFYAGKIYGKLGAFAQLTYNALGDALEMDNTDIRLADNTEIADLPITYGLSFNNNPTVQDLWNTTPVWGFPYTGSEITPTPAASTLLDGVLGTQTGGITAYSMINNLLYLEAGSYVAFSSSFQRDIVGVANKADRLNLDGLAPYWRVALQKDWKGHFFTVGHYGMSADVYPARIHTPTPDRYTDIAFDATYQYMANPKHIFEAKTSYIYEDQKLGATNEGIGKTYLNVFRFNTSYTFEQTYGVTFGYNKIDGSRNSTLYADNIINRPNSEYFTAELVYVPFGKEASLLGSLMNLRTSLQYIGYTQFDGTQQNAGNHNTFMVNAWVAF